MAYEFIWHMILHTTKFLMFICYHMNIHMVTYKYSYGI